jgi:transcriptional regulator with XRE-family HTH domain
MSEFADFIREADLEDRAEFVQELFMLELGELLLRAMAEQGVTQTELAERIGNHKSKISRILNADNVTVRSFAECFAALGQRVLPRCESLVDVGSEGKAAQKWEPPTSPPSVEELSNEYSMAA